jgi:hypothetical protein
MFSGTTTEFGRPERSSIIVVCKPVVYYFSRWGRVWITLVKLLLSLNGIFALKSNALSTLEIHVFPLF